jgi:hypothetical protein
MKRFCILLRLLLLVVDKLIAPTSHQKTAFQRRLHTVVQGPRSKRIDPSIGSYSASQQPQDNSSSKRLIDSSSKGSTPFKPSNSLVVEFSLAHKSLYSAVLQAFKAFLPAFVKHHKPSSSRQPSYRHKSLIVTRVSRIDCTKRIDPPHQAHRSSYRIYCTKRIDLHQQAFTAFLPTS